VSTRGEGAQFSRQEPPLFFSISLNRNENALQPLGLFSVACCDATPQAETLLQLIIRQRFISEWSPFRASGSDGATRIRRSNSQTSWTTDVAGQSCQHGLLRVPMNDTSKSICPASTATLDGAVAGQMVGANGGSGEGTALHAYV
jgi:hypothetical protein